jgi:hypothetical protein
LGYSGDNDQDKQTINSVADLANVFTHYFKRETAAERAVTNENSWQEILKAINEMEDKTHFIGGNAALIARTMSYNNITVCAALLFGLSQYLAT